MSGRPHLHGLAPGQHSFEETSLRWRAVGEVAPDSSGQVVEPIISHADSESLTTTLTRLVIVYFFALNKSWLETKNPTNFLNTIVLDLDDNNRMYLLLLLC